MAPGLNRMSQRSLLIRNWSHEYEVLIWETLLDRLADW
jgi:hypothetical protein